MYLTGSELLGACITCRLGSEEEIVHVCILGRFSCVQFFATLWAIACQAPLYVGIL